MTEQKELDVNMSYKDWKYFFDKYYEFRENVAKSKAKLANSYSARGELLENLSVFVDWVSEYVKEVQTVRDTYYEMTTLKNIEKAENLKKFMELYYQIWDEVGKDNKLYELLPKPNVEDEDGELQKFWKEEQVPKMREAMKAFSDMMSNYGGQ